MTIPRVLVVAGSDSGGGAGIQADIKTVTMLGGHATTAITAVTAQNTLGVTRVDVLPAEAVVAQIDAVLADIGADAVKIGMLGSAAVADAVADRLEARDPRHPFVSSEVETPPPSTSLGANGARRGADPRPAIPVVFDPVMVATSGAPLADAGTVAAFERLMRLATLVTPNLPELAALSGRAEATLGDRDTLVAAAREVAERFATMVLAKGGHGEGDDLVDRLIGPGGLVAEWTARRIETPHTHGTGCTLASAIAVGLAEGRALSDAIARARDYVRAALLAAPGLGGGHGPMGHGLGRTHFPPSS